MCVAIIRADPVVYNRLVSALTMEYYENSLKLLPVFLTNNVNFSLIRTIKLLLSVKTLNGLTSTIGRDI